MIKVICLLKKKTGLSEETFKQLCLDTAKDIKEEVSGLSKLSCTFFTKTLLKPHNQDISPFDGLIQIYFENSISLGLAMMNKKVQNLISKESEFVDITSISVNTAKNTFLFEHIPKQLEESVFSSPASPDFSPAASLLLVKQGAASRPIFDLAKICGAVLENYRFFKLFGYT